MAEEEEKKQQVREDRAEYLRSLRTSYDAVQGTNKS